MKAQQTFDKILKIQAETRYKIGRILTEATQYKPQYSSLIMNAIKYDIATELYEIWAVLLIFEITEAIKDNDLKTVKEVVEENQLLVETLEELRNVANELENAEITKYLDIAIENGKNEISFTHDK